jgi:hypothetical protein
MSDEIDTLLGLGEYARKRVIARLSQAERRTLMTQIEFRATNKWFHFRGDPVGFVEHGLRETTWSLQRDVMRSVVEHKRTSVPACHAPGKTHLAARVAAYWIAVHPPGTALVITTATTYRQVKDLLWPHIRRLHSLHNLIGSTTETSWKDKNVEGPLALGVKPPDDAEAGISGYHKAHLLIIVDEAGGIKRVFGQSIEALMTGVDTRLLVLGNPPVAGDASWFETISGSPLFNTIPIPYSKTPNFTGEKTGLCRSCPPEVDPHEIAQHLVDVDWVENLATEFGKDSAWFRARANAEFVHDSKTKTLPMDWLQLAADREPAGSGPISLGCDIAADGGDEFVVAKVDGWHVTIEHSSRGDENENAPQVAGVILKQIRAAEAEHAERGIGRKVRVKVDVIGVGWGVVGILEQWQAEGKFSAEIIGVNVAKAAGDTKQFYNQRSEMWWNMRRLLEPNNPAGGLLSLGLDNKELAQLNGPQYMTTSAGQISIEKKADMKKRGLHSPDRAEAILLGLYEPPGGEPDLGALKLPQAAQSDPWSTLE